MSIRTILTGGESEKIYDRSSILESADLQFFEELKRNDEKIKSHFDSLEAKYKENGLERPKYFDTLMGNFARYLLQNSKKYDSNLLLQSYELAFDLDKRVVQQFLETSALRQNFANFDEKIFTEYTGVDPNAVTYDVNLWDVSGLDNTNNNASLNFAQGGNEIRTIRAATQLIRRPIRSSQLAFELQLKELEVAASRNLPLQTALTDMTARSLGIDEQNFALYSTAGTQAFEKGLLNNTAIDNSITANVAWNTTASGFDIINDLNRIQAEIYSKVRNAFDQNGQTSSVLRGTIDTLPFCLLMSRYNLQLLKRPYSQLDSTPLLNSLTNLGIRVAGIPAMPNTFFIAYFNHPMIIELSTGVPLRSLPQSYTAQRLAYFCPYENVSAGITVKVPNGVFKISGINDPSLGVNVDLLSSKKFSQESTVKVDPKKG